MTKLSNNSETIKTEPKTKKQKMRSLHIKKSFELEIVFDYMRLVDLRMTLDVLRLWLYNFTFLV